MEVVLRICNEFDVDLPLQTVFTRPTVAQLATAVEDLIVRGGRRAQRRRGGAAGGGANAET